MPENPYQPPKEGGTTAIPRKRSRLLRTLVQALSVSVLVNLVAWVFIALTDLTLPRLMMGLGFGLAWHANVVPFAKYVILFGVNIGVWTLLALPVLLGAKTMYRKGKKSYEAR